MQSTRHDANLAALHSSALPGSIVDVIVLSSDGGLLATLRDASGPEHAIWHAPGADAAVELLIGGRCGIFIADLGTLRADAAALLARLHAQFPELVLMATGRRDEEASVASLVSDGRIYRFLHKPISPARGNLFLSAASRRYFELRNTQPMMMSTVRTMARRPPKTTLAVVAGALVLVLGGGLAWYAMRDPGLLDNEQALRAQTTRAQEIGNLLGAAKIAELSNRTSEPRGNNAIEHYENVLKLDPDNQEASTALERIANVLEAQVAAAIQRRDPAKGATALAVLRRARPDDPRLAALQSELIALSRSIHPSVPTRAPAPLMKQSPPRSAPVSLEQNANAPAASAPPRPIADPPPETPVDAPQVMPEEVNADALDQLALAVGLRERDKLLAPAGNNAFEYLQSLIVQYPDLEGVQAERQRLASTLVDSSRTALAAEQIDDAGRFLDAAQQLVPDLTAARALRKQVQAAQEERQFRESIAQAGSLRPLRPIQAEYPREARLRGINGWVDVEFTILPDGSTQDFVVREAQPTQIFEDSALEAIRHSRFQPFTKEGTAVRKRALLRVKYELE